MEKSYFSVIFHPLLSACFVSAFICALAYLYRDMALDVSLSSVEAGVFLAYLVLFPLLNARMLKESITSDELLHAERAVLYLNVAPLVIRNSQGLLGFLRTIPVSEVNTLISALIAGGGIGAYALWKQLFGASRRAVRYCVIFILLFAVGFLTSRRLIAVETFPPLRTLPLFLSQLVLGLDDFSFRLPGIVAVSILSLVFFKIIFERSQKFWFSFIVGFSFYLIPSVFHTSAAVQPSIWAFIAGGVCFLSMYLADEKNDPSYLVLAGLSVGIGTLFRQNAIIFWPALMLYACLRRPPLKILLKAFAPVLFVLPFLFSIAKMGYGVQKIYAVDGHRGVYNTFHLYGEGARPQTAAAHPSSDNMVKTISSLRGLRFVWDSLRYGIGPKAIFRSTTPLWTIFLFIGFLIHLFHVKPALNLFYLNFIPGYCLYYSVGPHLWVIGRYQAEYVAPFIALTLFLFAMAYRPTRTPWLLCLASYLGLYSIFMNQTITQDIYQNNFLYRRLSTEVYLPYKQALGYLQRQNTGGRFLVIGGANHYGRLVFWMRGFTFDEMDVYKTNREKYVEFIQTRYDAPGLLRFLDENRINFILVQRGSPVERQHRDPDRERLMELFGDTFYVHSHGSVPYVLRQSFIDDLEGSIDVWSRRQ